MIKTEPKVLVEDGLNRSRLVSFGGCLIVAEEVQPGLYLIELVRIGILLLKLTKESILILVEGGSAHSSETVQEIQVVVEVGARD